MWLPKELNHRSWEGKEMVYGELQHWGIKGMKWGVRRYQNKDGSLTPAGKQRYSEGGDSSSTTSSSSSSSSPRRKSVSEMTDDELKAAVQRLNLEQQYRNLNPQKVSIGKRFVNKVSKDILIPAATEVSKNAVKKVMDQFANQALDKLIKKATSKK